MYRIDCWVNPKSGFEIREANKIIKEISNEYNREFIIPNRYQGMILKSFYFSQTLGISIFATFIKENYPEAILSSWEII